MGLLAFFKRIFGGKNENGNGHSGDLQIPCVQCRKLFTFEAGEQKFYKTRGLTQPKRCHHCRGRRKSRR